MSYKYKTMKNLLTIIGVCIIVFTFSYIVCTSYHETNYVYSPNYISKNFDKEYQNLDLIKSYNEFKKSQSLQKHKISVSKTELKMFMYTVEMEAHDLSLEHKQAVAKVIVNRLNHKDFNYRNIKEVLSAKKQFSGFKNYKRQKFHPNLDTFIACKQALNDELKHLSDDMIYFYNPKKSSKTVHSFFEKKQLAMIMDGHRFFLSR